MTRSILRDLLHSLAVGALAAMFALVIIIGIGVYLRGWPS